ncbi:MAG: tannase/feruloyl esterase family alpha/beta hydrolase [Acidobacteria bacterium]|nr:tannase/feruloyl esterase family alpha/beta hydrolase [Acidobacteriota bacterium]
MRTPSAFVTVALVATALAGPAFPQQSCEKLKSLQLPGIEIVSATLVPEGPLDLTTAANPNARPAVVPARCDVKAVARPTSDSEIGFEVWLPPSGWNGKYMQLGNGGWAGSIPLPSMIAPLRRGYAAAGTDDGHKGNDASWAIGHPEKLIDFGYRAPHRTRAAAEAIVKAFYGRAPERNYFVGCSDGGREALMEAQRYPEDFNGIVAGAPANAWSRLFAGFVWNEQALLADPASAIPPAKLAAIQKAVLAACDALDGVKDSLIEDPRACRFDPAVLACKGTETADCLTAPQVKALARIYAGPKDPRTGEQIFPGYPPGTENAPAGWNPWITALAPPNAIQFFFGNSYYGQAVFERRDWDFRTMDFTNDVAFALRKAGAVIDSTNPDLRSFRAHGGKLIQYHGWGDAAISPLSSIAYYESVRSFLTRFPDPRSEGRKQVEDFYRLFLVPGMGHCGGGLGPNSFGNTGAWPAGDASHDILTAIETWVEQGTAPEELIGSGKVPEDAARTLTRPLCVYPQVARYKGSGDPYDAANFECAAERR